MSEAPSRRGRRPRLEQLEAMTIRISPKVRVGLDLLARIQGRSLTQAIEWALQSALANVKVSNAEGGTSSLLAVINSAWPRSGWQLTYALFSQNSNLVSFEERNACKWISESIEQQFVAKELADLSDVSEYEVVECARALDEAWTAIVSYIWPRLIADADAMVLEEQLLEQYEPFSICREFGLVDDHDKLMETDLLILKAAERIKQPPF